MGRTVALREDFDGPGLRRLAKASKDAGQSRRLLALAEIYDGGKRGDAARIGDVGLQVIRDWMLRFNAEGPGGLIDRKALGQPSILKVRKIFYVIDGSVGGRAAIIPKTHFTTSDCLIRIKAVRPLRSDWHDHRLFRLGD